MTRPTKVFISYSHADKLHLAELLTTLAGLKRQNLILPWHDREVRAGDDWKGVIDSNLEDADIIILLVTRSFIASDYCWDTEMARAMERHNAGDARVIPVFVSSSDWTGAPFARLQGVPDPKVPIDMAPNRDAAWTAVAEAIRKVVFQ